MPLQSRDLLAICLLCPAITVYAAGLSINSDGITFPDTTNQHTAYLGPLNNVIIVAKSGGDFVYLNSALASITDAGAANPYVLLVGPGVWTKTHLVMKPYVDIVGSGQGITVLRGDGSTNITQSPGVVVGADNAAIRNLTVEATGPVEDAVAIYNRSASPDIQDVTATVKGGSKSNRGVYNINGSSPTMFNMTITATGNSFSYGVYNNDASPSMRELRIIADGSTSNYGIYNTNASSPTIANVTSRAMDGSGTNTGIRNASDSDPNMTNVTSEGMGGIQAYGVFNLSSSPTMIQVMARGEGGAVSEGVHNAAASPTMMNISANATGGEDNVGVSNEVDSRPNMMNVLVMASGGSNSYGIHNVTSFPRMTSVMVSATGASESNRGVFNESLSGPRMNNVTATAEGTDSYGVYNLNAHPIIQGSYLKGDSGGLFGIQNNTRVSDTQIVNFVFGDIAGSQCRNVYDENLDDINC